MTGPIDATAGTSSRRPRERLYDRAFVGVLAVDFVGFIQWFLLQPVIPLLVIDMGGDAAMAGLAFAVFSIPSIVMRPVFGTLSDRLGIKRILLAGALGIAVVSPPYLIPSLAVLIPLRAIHGVFWAALVTSNTVLMARLAPLTRRGEAAAVFDLMPGLAQMIIPAIGLLVYHATGAPGTFLVATAAGLATWLIVLVTAPPDSSLVPAIPAAPQSREGRRGMPLLEPSAILPMTIQMLFMSGSPLFVVYPPLLAKEQGIPIAELAIYYPIYGILLVASRLGVSRVLDVVPRAALIVGSAIAAMVALLGLTQATSILPLVAAGAIYAVACGVSVPVQTAAVIDRSPPGRIGSAMGTYTIGFQLAAGFGAAVWGVLIAASGFDVTFVVAAGVQAVLAALAIATRRGLERPAALRQGRAATSG